MKYIIVNTATRNIISIDGPEHGVGKRAEFVRACLREEKDEEARSRMVIVQVPSGTDIRVYTPRQFMTDEEKWIT